MSAHLGLQDALDRLLDVGLEDVRLGQLLVPVRRQPDPGQRALLGQHKVRVEHGAAAKGNTLTESPLASRNLAAQTRGFFTAKICSRFMFLSSSREAASPGRR